LFVVVAFQTTFFFSCSGVVFRCETNRGGEREIDEARNTFLVLNLLDLLSDDSRIVLCDIFSTCFLVIEFTLVFVRITMLATEDATTTTWETNDADIFTALCTARLFLLLGGFARVTFKLS